MPGPNPVGCGPWTSANVAPSVVGHETWSPVLPRSTTRMFGTWVRTVSKTSATACLSLRDSLTGRHRDHRDQRVERADAERVDEFLLGV